MDFRRLRIIRTKHRNMHALFSDQLDVFFEVFVVDIGEITPEMCSSAFSSLLGGLGYEQADS